MKKSLIALFVAAFCIAGFAAENVLIYNYSLSYKRLNVTTRQEKVGSDIYTLDSPRVASDALTGYVIVDKCAQCNGTMTASSDTNDAVVYVVRKTNPKYYYTVVGNFDAAMFGAKSAYIDATSEGGIVYRSGYTKFTEASLFLDFDLSGAAMDANRIGFAGGYDNVSTGKIQNVGYGKVSNLTSTTTTSTKCITTSGSTTCYEVTKASGSAVSKLFYTGKCGDFVFDVCDYGNDTIVAYVALPGTFSLTMNSSLTKKYGADLTTACDYIESEYARKGIIDWDL